MVKLDHPTKPKPLLMGEEKQIILATVDGFGPYTHDKQRAIYLPAAALTLTEPDEVWEDSTLKTADWVYIKEFDQKPYTHTVFLIGYREEGHIVPVTSVPVRAAPARNKWRRGRKIYP